MWSLCFLALGMQFLDGYGYQDGGDIIADNFNVTAGYRFSNSSSATINADNFNVNFRNGDYRYYGDISSIGMQQSMRITSMLQQTAFPIEQQSVQIALTLYHLVSICLIMQIFMLEI